MGFIKNVKEEIQIIRDRDPAIHSNWEVFLYPSFQVMLSYRRAHKLYEKGHYFWARWISQRARRRTGIEIHPGAKIGVVGPNGMGKSTLLKVMAGLEEVSNGEAKRKGQASSDSGQ